jgi:hypothetical protein
MVQNKTIPRADRQPERTGKAQHQKPNVTRAVFATKNPNARSLLTRLLTKRAGGKTMYSWVAYSSIECTAWARIKNKNANRYRRSTDLLDHVGGRSQFFYKLALDLKLTLSLRVDHMKILLMVAMIASLSAPALLEAAKHASPFACDRAALRQKKGNGTLTS